MGLASSLAFAIPAPTLPIADVVDPNLSAVVRALTELRSGGEAARRRALERVVALGPGASATILALRTGRLTAVGDDGPLLDRAALEFLQEALRSWPAPDVGGQLVAEFDLQAPFGEQLALLDLMGQGADLQSFGLLLEQYSAADPQWLSAPAVQDRLADALGRAMRRERDSVYILGGHLPHACTAVLVPAARALGAEGRSPGLSVLSDLLNRESEVDLVVLRVLGEVDARTSAADAETCIVVLRPFLAAPDPRARVQAAISLAHLGDSDSVRPLIVGLSDDEPRVRRASLRGLQVLSGLAWSAEPQRWSEWQQAEEHWLRVRLRPLSRDLHSDSAGAVVRAVRELSAHPLFRRTLAPLLLEGLEHIEGSVTVAVCSGLERLKEPSVAFALVEYLTDPRPAVVQAVGRCLVTISGQSLPADAQTWYAWLEE